MAKWIWVSLVLLLFGAAGWWYFDSQSGATMTASEEARGSGTGRGGGGGGRRGRHRQGGPVVVTTASVSRQDVPIHVDGIGTVQAYNTVTVRARVDGQLDKVIFTEGQDVNSVKAGQMLGRLRLGQTDARLAQTLASLRAPETTLRGEPFTAAYARTRQGSAA